jgi:hypothetical protein
MPARRIELIARAFEEIFNQGVSASDGQQEYLFDDAGATLDAVVNLICFDSFRGDNRTDVFHKVDVAFLAGAAFALLVLASRAFEPQRGVATRAEARDFACVRAAFGAFDHALRRHGCAAWRFNSSTWNRAHASFGRCVAKFTGREISTHACILAGESRQERCVERECGLSVNTVRAYR